MRRTWPAGLVAALAASLAVAPPAAEAQGSHNSPILEFWLDPQNSGPGDIFWANDHLYVSDYIDGKHYAYGPVCGASGTTGTTGSTWRGAPRWIWSWCRPHSPA